MTCRRDLIANTLEIRFKEATPEDTSKIQFKFATSNPNFMHTNGVQIWMFKGISYELIGYGETNANSLKMRSIEIDSSVMDVTTAWNVPIGH